MKKFEAAREAFKDMIEIAETAQEALGTTHPGYVKEKIINQKEKCEIYEQVLAEVVEITGADNYANAMKRVRARFQDGAGRKGI